jgi:small ligand-binding sensory domain FIST
VQFASALTTQQDPATAGLDLSQRIRGQLNGRRPDLALLFVSSHYVEQIEDLLSHIRLELNPRVLIGATGEGVLAGAEEIEEAPAAALWAAHLPGVEVTPLRMTFSDEASLSAREWPDTLQSEAMPPTMLIFADPFSTPIDEVLTSLEDVYPGAIAVGGLVGGGRDQGGNRLLLNDMAYDNGLVGVALSGPVSIRTVVSQGCRPIGDRCVVTRAEQNVIHELSGQSALERLQSIFAELNVRDRELAQRALHIGIVMNEHRNHFERGDFLVRNLVGADRQSGSVAIGDLVKEGQTVQFHVRDADSADEDLHHLLAQERQRRPKAPLGVLVFSCCGRGRGLFGQPHHDVGVIREQVGGIPLAGFFAQGEIGPVAGRNYLHGYTASVVLFSEPDR